MPKTGESAKELLHHHAFFIDSAVGGALIGCKRGFSGASPVLQSQRSTSSQEGCGDYVGVRIQLLSGLVAKRFSWSKALASL